MAKRKNYLPKRIAGVKVPKAIRRGVLGEFLTSGAGQAIVAAVIIKAAQRLGDDVSHRGSRSEGGPSGLGGGGPDPAGVGAFSPGAGWSGGRPDASLNVKHALAEAARHFILGLSHPKEPKQRRNWGDPTSGQKSERGNGRSGEEDSRAAPDELSAHLS